MGHSIPNDNMPTNDPRTLLPIIGVAAVPPFVFERLRMLIENRLSGKTMRVSVAPIDGKPTACLINIGNRAYTGMYVPGLESEDDNDAIEASIVWTDARRYLASKLPVHTTMTYR